jgi:hypothetical protein
MYDSTIFILCSVVYINGYKEKETAELSTQKNYTDIHLLNLYRNWLTTDIGSCEWQRRVNYYSAGGVAKFPRNWYAVYKTASFPKSSINHQIYKTEKVSFSKPALSVVRYGIARIDTLTSVLKSSRVIESYGNYPHHQGFTKRVDTYSGSTRFESLYWLMIFAGFFSPPRQIPAVASPLGHDRFLSDPFKLVIHISCHYSTL